MKPAACCLLILSFWLGAARLGRPAEPAVAADLAPVVAAAATYESGQSLEPLRTLEEAVRSSVGKPAARLEVEAGLLKLLASASTFEARKFACQQLGIIGSEIALPEIAKMLRQAETVGIACLALSTYPPGKADAILREELKWANGYARLQILNTLGDRRDTKAVGRLTRQAGDPDPVVAESAIAALGKIGTPAAWKALASLRGKTVPAANDALEGALLQSADGWAAVGDAKKASTLYEDLLANSDKAAVRRSALAVLLRLDRDDGERRILETLAGTDTALKPVAIAAIPHVPGQGASEKFARELNHLKPEEQALMVESLAARGDEAARLVLAKALSSPEAPPRRAAIVATGRMGDPYFTSLLARAAAFATDPEELRCIETALSNLKGGAETDKRLVAELKTSLPKTRVQLMGAIMRRLGAAANPVFLEETDNSDPSVAKAAFRALGKTGTSNEAAALLTKLADVRDAGVRSEAESTAAQVLGKIPDVSRRSALVCGAFTKASTPGAKASFLSLLPACADAPALETAKSAAADSESQVRDAAVRALAEWPDVSARDALLALYRQPDLGSTHGIALRGLVRLVGEENERPDPKVVQHYRELLAGARGEADLKLILGTLANLAHPDALALALPMLSNPAVRAEAIVAVRKIAETTKTQNPQVAEEALKRLPNP